MGHGSNTQTIINLGSWLSERILSEHFEEEFVDILMAMIKAKFAFFQMEREGMLVKAPEANESSFGKGPKAFYSIDMGMLASKLVVAMLNTKVLLIAQIYQAIVATPAIRVNNAFKFHTATNYSLESGF